MEQKAVVRTAPQGGVSDAAVLDAVLRNSSDAICAVDRDGSLQYASDGFEVLLREITSRTPQRGHDVHHMLAGSDESFAALWRDLFHRATSGRSIAAEGTFVVARERRHLSLSASPVMERGEIAGAAFTIRDITEYRRRKQHEFVELALARIFSEHRPSRETFTRVLETLCVSTGWSLAIAWLADVDEQLLFPCAWWSDDRDRLEELASALEHAKTPRGAGTTGRVWASGRSVWLDDVYDESQVHRASFLPGHIHAAVLIPIRFGDQILGVLEFFSATSRGVERDLLALLDELGEIVGRFVRARQLEDERARLLTALERKGAEWTTTFDTIEAPILVVDPDGTIVRVNAAAAQLAGVSFREAVGVPLALVASTGPWKLVHAVFESVRDSGHPLTTQMEDADGRTWDIAANISKSNLTGERVIVVFRDISSMVEMQNSLRRGEQLAAMGELVAGVAHEVRNPLFGISATLDTLDLILGADPARVELFTALRGWVTRLNDLMQQLLEYGKTWNINLVEGDLGSVIDAAVDSCRRTTEAHRVAIRAEREPTPPLLMDSKRLVQVFENLVQNAAEHARSRVEISVAPAKRGGRDVIDCVVRDDGPGFNREDIPRVFQPFFTRRRAGTGLGLSIVQRIVEEHGGTVSAENHPEGGGLVRVTLPPLVLGPQKEWS